MMNARGADRAGVDWGKVLSVLRSAVDTIREAKAALGSVSHQGPTTSAQNLHPLITQAEAVHLPLVTRSLLSSSSLFTSNTVYQDRATNKTTALAELFAKYPVAQLNEMFPDFKETTLNIIGTSKFLVTERLLTTSYSTGSGAPLKLRVNCADVFRLSNGRVVEVGRYTDLTGLMKQVKLLPNMVLGHDEAPVSQTIDQTLQQVFDNSPIKVSFAPDDTPKADANRQNCYAIHEAFIKREPQAFNSLVAYNCTWADIPTGMVLDGRAAAVAHDYSNWAVAFPTNTAQVTNLIANEDWCVVEHVGEGAQNGDLVLGPLTISPTGKSVSMRVLDIVGYDASGQASMIRNYYDVTRMLEQLGVLDLIQQQQLQGLPQH